MGIDRGAKRKKSDSGRDSGGFVAIPWSVLDCPAYASLSHPGRSLLMEFARQLGPDRNGRLLASDAYLSKRGWKSPDVINRAKKELLAKGFVFQTVQGCRPNKASWFAVTWYALTPNSAYDPGVKVAFERGAYRKHEPQKNESLTPLRVVDKAVIATSDVVGNHPPTTPDVAIRATFPHLATTPDVDPLEVPCVGGFESADPVSTSRNHEPEVAP